MNHAASARLKANASTIFFADVFFFSCALSRLFETKNQFPTVAGYIKLALPAGKANPAPPVGPALGAKVGNFGRRESAKRFFFFGIVADDIFLCQIDEETNSFASRSRDVALLFCRSLPCRGVAIHRLPLIERPEPDNCKPRERTEKRITTEEFILPAAFALALALSPPLLLNLTPFSLSKTSTKTKNNQKQGVNIMDFCKQYNAATQDKAGTIIPVEITVYEDRSFTFILKTPPASVLLQKAAGIEKGSGNPKTEKVGTVTRAQLKEIAEIKLPDLNATGVEPAMRIIEGTAKNMGLTVVD